MPSKHKLSKFRWKINSSFFSLRVFQCLAAVHVLAHFLFVFECSSGECVGRLPCVSDTEYYVEARDK